MCSEDNLTALESRGHHYIIGARLRQLPKTLRERILKTHRYRRGLEKETGGSVGVFRHQGRRLVATYSPKRVAREWHLRQQALKRLLTKLNRGGSRVPCCPKGLPDS